MSRLVCCLYKKKKFSAKHFNTGLQTAEPGPKMQIYSGRIVDIFTGPSKRRQAIRCRSSLRPPEPPSAGASGDPPPCRKLGDSPRPRARRNEMRAVVQRVLSASVEVTTFSSTRHIPCILRGIIEEMGADLVFAGIAGGRPCGVGDRPGHPRPRRRPRD